MNNFKVGDWVTVKGTLAGDKFKLTDKEVEHKEILLAHFCFGEETWSHWEPKEGEWCFCTWNKENIILAQFNCMDDGHYLCTVLNGIKRRFNMCEPFIGELPSWIKETK
jgi:hypothetical protein